MKMIAYIWLGGQRGRTAKVHTTTRQRKVIKRIAAEEKATIVCEIIDANGTRINEAIAKARATRATLVFGKPRRNLYQASFWRTVADSGVKVHRDRTGFEQAAKASSEARTQRAFDAYQFIMPIIESMCEQHNMAEIAAHLNELGHVTTAGGQFTRKNLHRIVQIFERENVAV